MATKDKDEAPKGSENTTEQVAPPTSDVVQSEAMPAKQAKADDLPADVAFDVGTQLLWVGEDRYMPEVPARDLLGRDLRRLVFTRHGLTPGSDGYAESLVDTIASLTATGLYREA